MTKNNPQNRGLFYLRTAGDEFGIYLTKAINYP